MKEINWKVNLDKVVKDRYVATLDDENGDLVDWMVGTFETVKNYIGEQMKDVSHFTITWEDGIKRHYMKFEIAQ